ncbi:MAG TPA: hypothetical protein VFD84_15910 [Candidatus Binatia bacterium]|jgi:hypothetical protein|nr:hypothetical protein [Candidatus Binatia bacterium]
MTTLLPTGPIDVPTAALAPLVCGVALLLVLRAAIRARDRAHRAHGEPPVAGSATIRPAA